MTDDAPAAAQGPLDDTPAALSWAKLPAAAIYDPNLTAGQVRLLALLAHAADYTTHVVEKRSVNYMAARLGVSRSQVQISLRALVKAGYLHREQQTLPSGRKGWSGYTIIHRPVSAFDPTTVVRRSRGQGAQPGKATKMAAARAARATAQAAADSPVEAPRPAPHAPAASRAPVEGHNPVTPRGHNPVTPRGHNTIEPIPAPISSPAPQPRGATGQHRDVETRSGGQRGVRVARSYQLPDTLTPDEIRIRELVSTGMDREAAALVLLQAA